MGAAFREVLAAFGVDEDTSPPTMIVPWHGSTLVALEGGANLNVVPETSIVRVDKLDAGQAAQQLAAANQLLAHGRASRQLPKDAAYFKVTGDKTGGKKGVTLKAVAGKSSAKAEASIQAVVLGERPVKIAIVSLQTQNSKGEWVPHGKITFDPQVLFDQMNAIWLPQSNVRFKLVSTDPLRLGEKELNDELNRTKIDKDQFLEEVHLEAFDPMFRRHQAKDADFTIFLVKSILHRDLNASPRSGSRPAGATPTKASFCLVCDKAAADPVREARKVGTIPGIVPAHEAGHFMGLDNHVTDRNGTMLMVEGGPITGVGKVTVDQTTRIFNTKY